MRLEDFVFYQKFKLKQMNKIELEINSLAIDSSSQESGFELEHQVQSNSDILDNFEQIGQGYAGTGLSSPNKIQSRVGSNIGVSEGTDHFKIRPNANQKKVDIFHGKKQESDEDDAYQLNPPAVFNNEGKPLTHPTMQASMFARTFVGNRASIKKNVANTIEEESEQKVFSSISNVKKGGQLGGQKDTGPTRQELVGKIASAQNKRTLIPQQNKFQLATAHQWGFEPDKDSARFSKNQSSQQQRQSKEDLTEMNYVVDGGGSIDGGMQDYNTIQQNDQIANANKNYTKLNSTNSQDVALAEALRRSRQESVNDDEVSQKMTLELRDQQDVNPIDIRVGESSSASKQRMDSSSKVKSRGQSRTGRPPVNKDQAMIVKPSLAGKRKVKGNFGLAIQDNEVDVVQLNGLKTFQEEDVFTETPHGEKDKIKIKSNDDFGLDSDEELEISKRKKAEKQKKQEIEMKRDAEKQKILEEQRLAREAAAAQEEQKRREEKERKQREFREAREAAAAQQAERKNKQKQKAQEAAIAAEAEEKRIQEEQKRREEAQLRSRQEKQRLRDEAERRQREEAEQIQIQQQEDQLQASLIKISQQDHSTFQNQHDLSNSSSLHITPVVKDYPSIDQSITQVMSFEKQDLSIHINAITNDGLTSIAEMFSNDETTENNRVRKRTKQIVDKEQRSPSNQQTLRSDSKMMQTQEINTMFSHPPPAPERSELLNIEDSSQALSFVQNQPEEVKAKAAPPKQTQTTRKPGFFGRIGAMIGLMQQSKFADQDEDVDGARIESAASKTKQVQDERPIEVQPSQREQVQSRQSQAREQVQSRQGLGQELAAKKVDDDKLGSPPAETDRPILEQSAKRLDQSAKSSQNRSRMSNRSRRNEKNKQKDVFGDGRSPFEDSSKINIDEHSPMQVSNNSRGKVSGFIADNKNFKDFVNEGSRLGLKPNNSEEVLHKLDSGPRESQIYEEQKVRQQTPQSRVVSGRTLGLTTNGGNALTMNDRQVRQQNRLLKAAKMGADLNDSYYEEVESVDNKQSQAEQNDPYDINQKLGYESSSTAHKEVSKAALKLKKKLASFAKQEVTKLNQADYVENYVDPEKEETHVLFKEKKKMLQKQGLLLKAGDFNQLHPHSGKQAIIDTLRFVGVFIYLADLCLKIAYFLSTKWVSVQVRDLYFNVLYVRPVFVCFYHVWFILFSYQRSFVEYSRNKKLPAYNQVAAQPSENLMTTESENQAHKEIVASEKLKDQKKQLARSTLQRLCEITLQAVMLPITMYTGFARLVSLREIKTNYVYVSLGQEILLHQIPLTVLFWYNQSKLEKPKYVLDQVLLILSFVHLFWVFFEMSVLRGYLNAGINLEQRIKHTTVVRIKDTARLGFIAIIIGCLFLVPAYMAFEKQECKPTFYNYGEHECRYCFDYHGEECTACVNQETCTECVKGFYLNTTDSKCYQCKDLWKGCVDCTYKAPPNKNQTALNTIDLNKKQRELQTKPTNSTKPTTPTKPTVPEKTTFMIGNQEVGVGSKCIEAAAGFYFDKNGMVVNCANIANCEKGQCTEKGCAKCIEGYYLEDNQCKKCNLIGCAKCSSKTQCTECKSDFLQVQPDGSCKCNIADGIFPHMSLDRSGSCVCAEGYWLTEFGCQTCEELIPGCTSCYRTSQDTMIRLYSGADISSQSASSRQFYLDCRDCPYETFKVRPNAAAKQPPECRSCTKKWQGCGRCGSFGTRCESCTESHVFNQRNFQNPCRPCWCWMSRCIWCRGNTQCVKYWDKSQPWPEYDLSCK